MSTFSLLHILAFSPLTDSPLPMVLNFENQLFMLTKGLIMLMM
ncbi:MULTISPECIES: hypothetical protein [Morganella]|nr:MULTISPECIES: hypothetical protein [Morganella]